MRSVHLVSSLSLVMAACVGITVGVVGCKSRNYNAGVRAAGSSNGADVYTPELPSDITSDKLANWWKYGRGWEPLSAAQIAAIELSAEEQKDQFLQDNAKYPMTEVPPDDFSVDSVSDAFAKSVKPGETPPENFNPLQYIRLNVATKDRNKEQPTPRPLAAKTMLMALRKLREMTYIATSANYDEMSTKRAAYDSWKRCGYSTQPSDLPCREAFVVSSGDWEQNTLPVIPPHWGELQGHYYAQTGHVMHGCYTMAITYMGRYLDSSNSATPAPGKIPAKLERRVALEMCLNAAAGKSVADGWPERYGITLDDKSAFESAMSTVQQLAPAFKFFHDTQWVLAKDETGADKPVNVFDYMMMSNVYSFNFKQQEAVLNAYFIDSPFTATAGTSAGKFYSYQGSGYGVVPPRSYQSTDASGKLTTVKVTNLAKDALACHLFRPIRSQDIDKNPDGSLYNYCALDKQLNQAIGNINR